MLLNSDLSDGEYSLNSLDVKTKGNTTCTSYTIKSNTVVSASNCEANGYTYSYNMENGAYILAGSKGSNADIYAKNNGRLHVTGSKLMNSKNQEFRLIGASNAVAPQAPNAPRRKPDNNMYTERSLLNLKNWGGNGFRIFCGNVFFDNTSEDYNHYLDELKEVIDTLIKLDMYVILNWNPGGISNGAPLTEAAKNFFNDISSYYKNDYHILYEVWNEPENVAWSTIKSHADALIPVIRKNAPDAIVLVGTPQWDKRVDLVINNQLNYKNIMYTHHTYASNVNETEIGYVKKALDAGIPIFETECSSTNGGTPKGNSIDEAQANAFFTFLKKYNISFMYFCWESGWWSYNFVDIDKNHTKWDETLPDYLLRESAFHFRRVLKNDFRTSEYLMRSNGTKEGLYYRTSEWKDKIISVSFENKINVPSNAAIKWDLSFNGDNTVIGYLTPAKESGMYNLVIAANGFINLPSDSSRLFEGLTNVKSYDFKNVKTKYLNNMNYMFKMNKSVVDLDLSGFDTSRLVGMIETFASDNKLVNLNLSGWNPKLLEIVGAFSSCQSLESLDLSGFDVSRVTNFGQLFFLDKSLKSLNISSWSPNKVKNINNMFHMLSSIDEIDMSNFKNFDSNYTTQGLFEYINKDVVIKTGNEKFKADMKEKYPNLNIQ